MSKTIKISFLSVGVLGVLVYLMAIAPSFAAEFPQQSAVPTHHASTTAYALTWGADSTQIIATSTREAETSIIPATAGRSALTLQTTDCGTDGEVWLQFNDVAAATSTGYWLNSSTTVTFGDDVPMVDGSVRAMSSTANCTVLVTEWRTKF